jgi:hypothetical protein
MPHALTTQEHISSIDGRLIFPVGVKLCPPSAIHCAYSFLMLSLNGLLRELRDGVNYASKYAFYKSGNRSNKNSDKPSGSN